MDIINFVSRDDGDSLPFYKPYYLEVEKGGDKAYALLRDALVDSGKIAIALVVILARQHLAAVEPQKNGLILELMHFPEELLDASQFKAPVEKAAGKAEMQMAKHLVQSMTSEWKPEQYTDQYHEALEKIIEEKIKHGEEEIPTPVKKKKPTKLSIWCLSFAKALSKHGQKRCPSIPPKPDRHVARKPHRTSQAI